MISPRYRFDPRPGGSQRVVLDLVPPGSAVLDVGCATGYLGTHLAEKGCEVWGIEKDRDAIAAIPANAYVEVANIDLDEVGELPWRARLFDVVIAADVLEHLRKPNAALVMLRKRMRRDAYLLVSLPNVAHFSVRFALLFGQFRYQPSGILDRTHLHLYTYTSAIKLIQDAGFSRLRVLSGSDRLGTILNRAAWVTRPIRGLVAYNIVIVAQSS